MQKVREADKKKTHKLIQNDFLSFENTDSHMHNNFFFFALFVILSSPQCLNLYAAINLKDMKN